MSSSIPVRRWLVPTLALLSLALLVGCDAESDTNPSEGTATSVAPTTEAQATTTEMPPLFYRHEVQPGETIASIAADFGVAEEYVRWSNPEAVGEGEPTIGTALDIPAVDGVLHTVEDGETVDAIASRYGVTAEDIIDLPSNGLSIGDQPDPGSVLLVPEGRLS